MDVKPGYKHTELGVIPVEWGVKPLNELFGFSGGFSASRDQLSSEGFCYLHYGDIHKSSKTYIDVQSEYQDIPKLDIPLKRISQASLLDDGDVVFVDASEDDEGTSKHVVIFNKEKIPYISGLHTIVAKSKTNDLDQNYKRYCFQTLSIKSQFYYFSVGTKVSGISKTNIGKITLPLPPIPEQQAIAKSLGDADAIIEALEQLIAKKRNIMQGAMQELLTGKKRLPGFYAKWNTVRLQSLLSYERPDQYIVQDTQYSEYGNTPVLTANKSFVLGYTDENFGICRDIPVIVFDDFTTDSKYVDFPFKVKSSAIKLLRPKHDQVNLRFVFQRMRLIQFPLGDHKRYYISEYQNLELEVPDYAEQTAIAAVLSDMDAEINILETKLTKARQIKQGMMQELLTGRIRLI